ncbi:MAG: bifunctional diguanylate cyclase/phosphodiesterase [Solibacillus sp.]
MSNMAIRNEVLSRILQLNPFDAVVILRKEEQQFFVTKANERANELIDRKLKQEIEADTYFGSFYWQLFSKFLVSDETMTICETVNGEPLKVAKSNIAIDGIGYDIIVIRELNDATYTNMSKIVFLDELTSLFNRRALNEHWRERLFNEERGHVALVLVDLDRFKKFNESIGKQKADGMLTEVSERFRQLRTTHCEVYRYSGDEFVFLLEYENHSEVEALAAAVLKLLDAPFVVDRQEYYITASIGIAFALKEQEQDLETLLHCADQALFHVKEHGRAHYRFFESKMNLTFPNDALMEAHLRRAVEFDEMQLHFQPQIDLGTNQINSFEALIRWNNRKFGAVPPSEFIPIAESSGLILPLGDWILERVFRYQKEWREKGYRVVRIAINISPKQFKQEKFVEKLQMLLERYNIEPSSIELEITEGSMMNVEETIVILQQLKNLGVYVSVDDFGTGYSSLSYLKKYPIDIIKIDQSFIADIAKDKKNEAIVKAIILLSHNLGLEVIAEGVEEKKQEQFLKQYNCQKVQGYLYNKPLPAQRIVEKYLM